jgi:hypothetical protein
MANPRLGVQEYPELRALVHDRDALALGYGDPVITRAPLARYVDSAVLSRHRRLLLDAYQGAAIAAQLDPQDARLIVMTFDRRFRASLADPVAHRISHVLVPDPASWPQDVVNRTRPRLWAGKEPGFVLAKAFDAGPKTGLPESWRLYSVRRDARVLPTEEVGGG